MVVHTSIGQGQSDFEFFILTMRKCAKTEYALLRFQVETSINEQKQTRALMFPYTINKTSL